VRATFRLTLANPYESISLPWDAVAMVVDNPTASPIFVRAGAPDIPSEGNADAIVPSAKGRSLTVSGREYGVTFGQTALLTVPSGTVSGLFSTALVTLLSAGETIPTFGDYSFLSLSLSEIVPLTAYAGAVTGPTVDLGSWGGALISIFPTAGTGQAVARVEVSADQTAWRTLNSWAIWPGVPVTLTVPHGLRYLRVAFAATAIPGEPAIGGSYAIRATLTEISNLVYSQAALGISKAVNVAHLGTTTNYFATIGLPGVSIRWQGLTGNPNGEAIWWTGPTETGPWALVAFREQVMGGASASLYRSVGSLDKFLRVDILDTDVTAGGLTGTLTLTTVPDPDLTSYLQNIYAALGDVGQAVPNVNQSLFHLLQHIETWTGQASVSVASIDSKTSTVITSLSTINLSIGTSNTTLSAINTNTAPIPASLTRSSSPGGYNAIVTATFWANLGAILVPGWYITQIQISYIGAAAGPTEIFFGVGTGIGTPAVLLLKSWVYVAVANGVYSIPNIQLDGQRSGGYLIPAGNTNAYVQSTQANGQCDVILTQVPP
jgi:hypothetical protein